MGAKVSRLGRLIKNPLQATRNVDKILESKPATAPKHASSLDAIERIRSETAEEFKKRDSKDDRFLNMMKDIKIQSSDFNYLEKETNEESKRKLPQVRHSQEKTLTQVREGKISTQNLTELFQKHMNSPSEWTAEKISGHYKLDPKDVEILLKYFSGYAIVEKRELPRPLEKVTFIE